MKIIKRNGSEVAFDITKIIVAITKANEDVDEADRMTPVQIRRIAESVELQCQRITIFCAFFSPQYPLSCVDCEVLTNFPLDFWFRFSSIFWLSPLHHHHI